jgi:hypothetical protein
VDCSRRAATSALAKASGGIRVLADAKDDSRSQMLLDEAAEPVRSRDRVRLQPKNAAVDHGTADERRGEEPLRVPLADEGDLRRGAAVVVPLCIGEAQQVGDDLVPLRVGDIEAVDHQDEVLAVRVLELLWRA